MIVSRILRGLSLGIFMPATFLGFKLALDGIRHDGETAVTYLMISMAMSLLSLTFRPAYAGTACGVRPSAGGEG